jgi:UDP-N-acetylglucosamine 2-epimerase (non-hydrolysing)
MKKKILIVVGTRPNIIKITQFKKLAVLDHPSLEIKIIHTGQHSNDKMSTVFFDELDVHPDFYIHLNSVTPLSQIGEIISKMEEVIQSYKPDLLLVVGDVNSTFAAAVTANRMSVKLAHVESGLRSNDRTMPEEINRILTDDLADYFFVTEQSGLDNLLREGKKKESVFMVGNTMIDTLVAFSDAIQSSPVLRKLNINPGAYVLMTMHRPSNVDTFEGLRKIIDLISELSSRYQVIFPIHPRTSGNLKKFGLQGILEKNTKIILTEPLDYFSFQKLILESVMVITDSGGVQEETTFRNIPCFTLRPNTERPVTITEGSNELLPFDVKLICERVFGEKKSGRIPSLWDGKATVRILDLIDSKILV